MNSQLSARSRSQIRNRTGKLAGKNIRNYPQWTCPVSAINRKIEAILLTLLSKRDNDFDNSDCFDGYTSSPSVITAPSDNHPIIIRYFPGIIRFTQGTCRFSSSAPKTNRPIIDRRNHRTDRSGCRNRSVESSDNRQMISGNRQIPSPMERPSGPWNHQLIVNQFHVIINSAARNLSPIHHQNAEIYHRADRPHAIRLLESSDNHPTKRRNHPTAVSESTDNRPTNSRNLPILPVNKEY